MQPTTSREANSVSLPAEEPSHPFGGSWAIHFYFGSAELKEASMRSRVPTIPVKRGGTQKAVFLFLSLLQGKPFSAVKQFDWRSLILPSSSGHAGLHLDSHSWFGEQDVISRASMRAIATTKSIRILLADTTVDFAVQLGDEWLTSDSFSQRVAVNLVQQGPVGECTIRRDAGTKDLWRPSAQVPKRFTSDQIFDQYARLRILILRL